MWPAVLPFRLCSAATHAHACCRADCGPGQCAALLQIAALLSRQGKHEEAAASFARASAALSPVMQVRGQPALLMQTQADTKPRGPQVLLRLSGAQLWLAAGDTVRCSHELAEAHELTAALPPDCPSLAALQLHAAMLEVLQSLATGALNELLLSASYRDSSAAC